MTKDEQKAKYGRIANDPSQLEMFKDDVIDGEVNGLPETPSESYDTPVVLKCKNGELVWEEEGGGPTPPVPPTPPTPSLVVKGDVILLDGKPYRVLQANADNTDVELISLQGTAVTRYIEGSPSSEQVVYFQTESGTYEGIKYEGSIADQYCQTDFIASLPQDVQDAIIEQQVVQDMYEAAGYSVSGEAIFTLTRDDFANGSNPYRVFKRSTESVIVGMRKAYLPSFDDMVRYFGSSATSLNFLKVFCGYSLIRSARMDSRNTIYYVYLETGATISNNHASVNFLAQPMFHVDLTQVEYSK